MKLFKKKKKYGAKLAFYLWKWNWFETYLIYMLFLCHVQINIPLDLLDNESICLFMKIISLTKSVTDTFNTFFTILYFLLHLMKLYILFLYNHYCVYHNSEFYKYQRESFPKGPPSRSSCSIHKEGMWRKI